jgi:uncharacterized membrane protein YeiH
MTELGTFFLTIDLASVLMGGLAGGLIARAEPDYDITGVFGIALVSGIGGGLLRDLFVADGPPLPLLHQQYLLVCLLGGALAFLVGGRLRPILTHPVTALVNTLAFGSFAMTGALRGQHAGFGPLAVLFLCIVASSTGGLIRDVLMNKPPDLFRTGQLMAVAAVAGGAVFLLCDAAGASRSIAVSAGGAVVIIVRYAAIRFNIKAPVPHRPSPAPAAVTPQPQPRDRTG